MSTRLSQIFVCATPGEGRCGAKGGIELLEEFRAEVERLGLSPSAVVLNACTRRHHEGPVVFVYPDDVWYTRVRPKDVAGIVERHLAPLPENLAPQHFSAKPHPSQGSLHRPV